MRAHFGLRPSSSAPFSGSPGARAAISAFRPPRPHEEAGIVRQFGRRPRAAGISHAAGAPGADTHANSSLFPLPSGSMRDQPGRSPLESLNLSQTIFEKLVAGLTGVLLVFAFFLLFFVRL